MRILDGPLYRLIIQQIPIETPASLPEAKATIDLTGGEEPEGFRTHFSGVVRESPSGRLLDRSQNIADMHFRRREKDEVNMLRHEDVTQKQEADLLTR